MEKVGGGHALPQPPATTSCHNLLPHAWTCVAYHSPPSALGPPPPLAAFLQAADLSLSISNPSSPPASPADPHFPQTDSLSLKGTAHLYYTPGLLTLPPLSLCLPTPSAHRPPV